ncbi:MAG TPA: T9SS type A sorting domain-containing protein [Bacteroidia bacterium]|nr:T9SS type A sorting domain-containing protein [Bacteroidia bacterium]
MKPIATAILILLVLIIFLFFAVRNANRQNLIPTGSDAHDIKERAGMGGETIMLFFMVYLITLCIFSFFSVKGQNLVPNGDFEQYSSCPTFLNQLSKATFWINPAATATPDYFHQCGSGQAGIPNNYFGHQSPHSGAGYCGLMHYHLNYAHYREYAEVQLTSPLQANQCYHFEMHVSLADKAYYSTDDLSVYFSDTLVTGISYWTNLTFVPQINNSGGIIADTANWVMVSGNFQATGGESYMLIGNFLNDSNITVFTNSFGNYDGAFYYIDDVSLTPCTGTEEISHSNDELTIYPNPVKDELKINFKNKIEEIKIFDVLGKEIYKKQFSNSNLQIPTSGFMKGIYFIEINNSKDTFRKKFLKE